MTHPLRWLYALMFALLLPIAARADGDVQIALPEALPEALGAPLRLEQQAVELIEGFGEGGQIDAAGLALSISSERAAARATALRRFLALDLDGDMTLSATEAAEATSVLAAKARGRLMSLIAEADLDGDRALSLPELRLAGEKAALRALSEARAAERMALMAFDQDGDGWLGRDEIRSVLAAMASAPADPPPPNGAVSRNGI